MKQHTAIAIEYCKSVGGSGELTRFESTDRTIIPTFIPPDNVKAIDVTEMDDVDIVRLEARLAEYAEYYKVAAKSISSFDNWLEQSHQEFADIKWRTFKTSGITEK